MSPRIISHRGKTDLSSPENDLTGIEEAINLGVDMVEFDVRKTFDEVLVCQHDAKINGVSVSNLTYGSLKSSNEHLCRLEEVLFLCKGKIGVNLEIKEEGFETEVVDLLVANFSYDNIYVTSFIPSVIRRVKCQDSKIVSGLLLGDAISYQVFYKIIKEAISMEDFYYSKADFIAPFYKIYEMGLMRNFQKKEVPIQLWTVNELNLLKDLINSDIHSIVTDVPSKILGN
ncbi:MAG: hypothetical protein BEU01_01415 [Marine Group III euryarchaeote CG-Epi4]|uniref:GP-PDE domain-containing protein n=1 Tax=Marine Group III euryarchaeote CG-Epi4 TaxID=1888998 RepID=A0A1J5TI89_9ARCH|nr:MAG: hypothetical protein BEU01_01415 [Marine Group III euryarchaeote CG-Epi4]|tara:strand:+ start:299 stop:985 length:687 start_codon:yes stop_codon:yes gene_type:complete